MMKVLADLKRDNPHLHKRIETSLPSAEVEEAASPSKVRLEGQFFLLLINNTIKILGNTC